MRRFPTLLAILLILLVAACRTVPPSSQTSTPGAESTSWLVETPGSEGESAETSEDRPTQAVTYSSYPSAPEAFQEGPAESVPAGPRTEGVMVLEQFEQMAEQSNPALAEAAARIDAARGNWLQVGLRPNPTIGYSGQQLGSGGQAEQQGGFLGQQFITGGKLGLNREIAAWEIRRAENEWEATRLRVLTDVRIAFYDVLIAQRRRELTSELVRISDQAVQAAQALFEGEEVSEADPLRARVEADTARILLQNAINAHVAAWRRLAALVGAPDMPLQQVEGKLNPDDMAMSWEEALAKLLAESPELAAAEADVEAARWAVQRAYAAVVPDIDVQAVVQDDRGTGSSNANLQVTFPLPLWNRNQGGIQQAFAQSVAAEMAVNRLRLDLQTRLADAFQRYRTAHNQVREYSKPGGIIANSQRTLELIRSGYQAEEFGILDLLTAQRTFFQTNLAYLDALRELAAATMEIRGLLLSGSLSR